MVKLPVVTPEQWYRIYWVIVLTLGGCAALGLARWLLVQPIIDAIRAIP